MSILNTEEISNPDIRLNQTNNMPIVQFYREAMFTRWMRDNHMWPDWALLIRYPITCGTTKQEDPIQVFYKSTKILEQYVLQRIGLFRIDNIDGQLKYLIHLMFDDVLININKRETGDAYFIYNRQSGGIVMSIIFTGL